MSEPQNPKRKIRYPNRRLYVTIADELATMVPLIAGSFEASDCSVLIRKILEGLRDSVTNLVRHSDWEGEGEKEAILVQSMKINQAFDRAIATLNQFEDHLGNRCIPVSEAEDACESVDYLRDALQTIEEKITEVFPPEEPKP